MFPRPNDSQETIRRIVGKDSCGARDSPREEPKLREIAFGRMRATHGAVNSASTCRAGYIPPARWPIQFAASDRAGVFFDTGKSSPPSEPRLCTEEAVVVGIVFALFPARQSHRRFSSPASRLQSELSLSPLRPFFFPSTNDAPAAPRSIRRLIRTPIWVSAVQGETSVQSARTKFPLEFPRCRKFRG